MDFQVIWTELATSDLESIISYIAQDNLSAAEKYGDKLLKKVELLQRLPFLGSVFSGDPKGRVRELLYRKHRIFYRVKEESHKVEILTVRHGSRDEPDPDSF